MGDQAQTRPMCGVRRIERNDDLASKLGQGHKACYHMSEPPLYQKGVTVGTDYPSHSPVLWVTVAGIRDSQRRWTNLLTEDKPGSLKDRTICDRPIPTGKLCHSYAELCVWLYAYGCPPPPPDYFTPTQEEIDEGIESILRRVTCSHLSRADFNQAIQTGRLLKDH